MKRIKDKRFLITVILLLLIIFLAIFLFRGETKPEVSLVGKEQANLQIPQGRQEYEIAQEAEIYPRFLKAIVDPVDVKPGDLQKYEVILVDRSEIVSVIAYIERDSGTTTLELKRITQEPVSFEDLNQKYLVVNNKLVINNGSIKPVFAQAEKLQKFVYQGVWQVVDTHSRTYRTKIVAENSQGEQNELILTWTDPCTPPACGNWAVDDNCTFSNNDGVENGNVTGFNSAYTVTLNATFIVNEGYSITINNGGKFAISTNGQIKFGEIYVYDGDRDNYGNRSDQRVGSATGYVSRALKCAFDCYDANANAYPGQTNYFISNRGDGSYDYDCDGTISKQGVTCNGCADGGHVNYCGVSDKNPRSISGFDLDAKSTFDCGLGPYSYAAANYCYCVPADGLKNYCNSGIYVECGNTNICSTNWYIGCK